MRRGKRDVVGGTFLPSSEPELGAATSGAACIMRAGGKGTRAAGSTWQLLLVLWM